MQTMPTAQNKKLNAIKEIARAVLENKKNIDEAKREVSRKYALERIPKNSEILKAAESSKEREALAKILKKKPVRTISGVAVVAAMTKPLPCPHGKCLYCPQGKNAAQSYTGEEPASLRAKSFDYDPYLQVEHRLSQLNSIGHSVDKAELIVMGGTFPAQDFEYQSYFVKRCFDAMNDFGHNEVGKKKIETKKVEEAHKGNEKAKVRNVGLTFETRPDYCKAEHVDNMLSLGATRVELGVQTLNEEVYEKVKRGHSIKDVVEATRIAKDAGLKVCYHMMPGLFSAPEEDLEMFKALFEKNEFKPDMLKIYPALVIKGTGLYELWKKGEFSPYTEREAVRLIADVKEILPRWVRVMRIQRDIPARLIEAGVKQGNLAELADEELERRNAKCECIRCREAGHAIYKNKIDASSLNSIKIKEERYKASEGEEHFISAQANDFLFGYARLRFPSEKAHRKEIKSRGASEVGIIRELKICGESLKLGDKKHAAFQHKGMGKALLKKAEEIAEREGKKHMLIRSAVGTRKYYRKLEYRKRGAYVYKRI